MRWKQHQSQQQQQQQQQWSLKNDGDSFLYVWFPPLLAMGRRSRLGVVVPPFLLLGTAAFIDTDPWLALMRIDNMDDAVPLQYY